MSLGNASPSVSKNSFSRNWSFPFRVKKMRGFHAGPVPVGTSIWWSIDFFTSFFPILFFSKRSLAVLVKPNFLVDHSKAQPVTRSQTYLHLICPPKSTYLRASPICSALWLIVSGPCQVPADWPNILSSANHFYDYTGHSPRFFCSRLCFISLVSRRSNRFSDSRAMPRHQQKRWVLGDPWGILNLERKLNFQFARGGDSTFNLLPFPFR